MKNELPVTSPIAGDWPSDGLEQLEACPFCRSPGRTLALRDVRDWTFDCAPGKWTYWNCAGCSGLYLNPRPSVEAISLAYQRYYTHGANEKPVGIQKLKRLLINECWSQWLHTDIWPRIGVPDALAAPLRLLHSQIPPPFELEAIAAFDKGTLMDVGCGDGGTLKLAALLGWKVMGLELDISAVRAARAAGLNVVEGSYVQLKEYKLQFDCVICSHLIEHVHEPLLLLKWIAQALKAGGTALLSCPNSLSYVRQRFGASWRGLEAPRHLGIPSLDWLVSEMRTLGFSVERMDPVGSTTTKQSKRIHAVRKQLAGSEPGLVVEDCMPFGDRRSHPDLIQLVCTKC